MWGQILERDIRWSWFPLSAWMLLAYEAWSHCSHLGPVRRGRLMNQPVWGGWQNIKAAWSMMISLFYKTSPAPAQSPDFLLDSQYISRGLSHCSEGLPLLLTENIQTPLDIHTYFFLPSPTPSGSPFFGCPWGRRPCNRVKSTDFWLRLPGPKLGLVTCPLVRQWQIPEYARLWFPHLWKVANQKLNFMKLWWRFKELVHLKKLESFSPSSQSIKGESRQGDYSINHVFGHTLCLDQNIRLDYLRWPISQHFWLIKNSIFTWFNLPPLKVKL